MKNHGSGKLQEKFEIYWQECSDGVHDEVCPYFFAGKYGCTVRHARRLILNKLSQKPLRNP